MKIVGQIVVGPGEAGRFLERTLKEFQRLTDDAVAVTCGAGEAEVSLLDKYDIRHYADNRPWGTHQPHIKTDLLRRILALQPHWVLPLDSDEELPTVDRAVLQGIADDPAGRDAAHFFVVNLWNDEQHYLRTGPAGPFWNVRFYRADESKGTQFLRKALHCGNAPPYFYSLPARDTYVPHILLHRGLMLPEERLRRVNRYKQYDPNATHKGRDYYDQLAAEATGTVYDQAAILASIRAYCATLPPPRGKPNTPMPSPEKFYYVKRNDEEHNGSVVDIPGASLAATLQLHPSWVVIGEAGP